MKKFNIFNLFIIFSIICSSCESNKDMLMYDAENDNYVYFALPFTIDDYGRLTDIRMDSMEMSFAFQELGTEEYTFQIPVNLAGISSNDDREYRLRVVPERTTAVEGEYMPIPEKMKFRAGRFIDTLSVTVYMSETLKTMKRRLVIEILPSEDFKPGSTEDKEVVLTFTNILSEPYWWGVWKGYLGEFCQEKYQRWINQYPEPEEGMPSDTNLYGDEKAVYWNNMPDFFIVESWYPITFMQIATMKTFFQENIFYVDGDPDKGRVTLP